MTTLDSDVDTVQGYRVELARGVADIDRESWNDVVHRARGSVFHAWEWLAAFEESPPGVFEPMHLLAYAADQVVAVCPAYLVRRCDRLEYALSLGEIEPGGPILLAHSLAGFAGGPLTRPDHPGAADRLVAAFEHTGEALDAWAWGFANLSSHSLLGRLIGSGYAAAQLATTYMMDTQYSNSDAYWNAMRSHRRRKLAREKRLRSRGLTVAETAPDVDTLVRLVHSLLQDRGVPVEVLPEGFLGALRRRLAPYEHVITATDKAEETVAVFLGWRFGSEWSAWSAGLDVARLGSFEPYHPMLAHLIETAVDSGTSALNLGRGNAEVKRRYGAFGIPLFLALTSNCRGRNASLHAACRAMEAQSRGPSDGLEVVRRCC